MKPEPRIVKQVCSLCGLDWKAHGKAPTSETCIKLLLAEVRSLEGQLATRPYPVLYPYVQPVLYRPRVPQWPQWVRTTSSGASASGLTPQLSNTAPLALNQ